MVAADYPNSEIGGKYVRPTSEYERPCGRLVIEDEFHVTDTINLSATYFHSRPLSRFRDGQIVELELVPEPGNPWDPRAVAADINGRRVGYLSRRGAGMWHDVVRAANRSGLAVVLRGEIERWGDEDEEIGVAMSYLEWDDLFSLARRFGLDDPYALVVDGLTDDERALLERDHGLMGGGWDPDPGALQLLYELRHQFPMLTWGDPSESVVARTPFWLGRSIREAAIQRNRRAREAERISKATRRREAREAEREGARRRREETLERNSTVRAEVDAQLLARHATGQTLAAIAADSGLTVSQVSRAVARARKRHGQVSDWHESAQRERVATALEAKRLQREGRSQVEIAAHMGRTRGSVAQLLSDGAFYENPLSRPERFILAEAFENLGNKGLARDAIIAELGVSRMQGLRAFRDAQVIFHLLD